MTTPQKTNEKKQAAIAMAVIVVLAVGGLYGYGAFFGGKIGESCEDSAGCMTHGVCISHRCQLRCEETADCGAGYHCGTAQVKIVHEHLLGDDETQSSEKICFPNKQ